MITAELKKTGTYLPRWTKREVIESSGRDPLGLSRVSDALTEYLLPGIITTTHRARYYSFYPWLIADAAEARDNGDDAPFQQAFMQRDTAFGVASFLAQGGGTSLNVVGSDEIRWRRNEFEATGIVDTSFRLLPSNDFGGLDQYYASCLGVLNLIVRNQLETVWSLTDTGKKMGAAFAHSVAKTPFIQKRYNKKTEIPLERLRDSAKSFSLIGLRNREAFTERELLIELLFGFDSSTISALLRQQTLGLILDVINQTGPLPREEFGLLYAPQYYDKIAKIDGSYRPYRAGDRWSSTRSFWRQFCAHQYLAVALEYFLSSMLASLAPHADGLTAKQLTESLTGRDLVDALSDWIGKECPSPRQLMHGLGIRQVPDEQSCLKNRKHWIPGSNLAECHILKGLADRELSQIAISILLLAIVYGKWRSCDDDEWQQIGQRYTKELWIGTFLPLLDGWLDVNATWTGVIASLVDFTFKRHEQVMFQKQRLEACWLSYTDGHFCKEQDMEAGFRSSRHVNALQIFYDLALVDYRAEGKHWQISETGKKLLKRLKALP